MSLKDKLKKLVENSAHIRIFGVLPRGIDVVYDIANSFPMYRVDIVFDVGANVGQSAKHYLKCFPNSHIYCFEPSSNTFRRLQDNLEVNDRIHCVQMALSSSRGKGKLYRAIRKHSS